MSTEGYISMRRYFGTGLTGFIGREIVRQLLERNDTESITCLTRGARTNLIEHPKIQYWIGDMMDCNFPAEPFTDLIHGACEANDLMQPDQYRYYHDIVEGTNRILQWAENVGIQNCLLLSSGAITRDTIYGRAKRQSELLAKHYGDTKIARIYSVIGEEMPLNGQFAAGKFIWQALNEGKVSLYGGQSERCYLDVKDCANWILSILDDGFHSDPYDVSSTDQISIADLAQKIAEIWHVPFEHIEGEDRIDRYSPNIKQAIQLGCRQTISLDQSLERIHKTLC